MNTKELIDRIFKEPGIKFELTEFETLDKPIHDIIAIYPKPVATGKEAGKTKYYLKSFIPFSSDSIAVQIQVEIYQRGTSGQLELYYFDIRRFLVWPAPESLQRELRETYDKAALAERESKQLLEQAKAHVEQLIEEAAQA